MSAGDLAIFGSTSLFPRIDVLLVCQIHYRTGVKESLIWGLVLFFSRKCESVR